MTFVFWADVGSGRTPPSPRPIGHAAVKAVGNGACLVRFPSPFRTAFPVTQAGRHPHRCFRALLGLHSHYGPLTRSAAQGDLCHRASAHRLPDKLPVSCSTKPATIEVEPASTGNTPLRGTCTKSRGEIVQRAQPRRTLFCARRTAVRGAVAHPTAPDIRYPTSELLHPRPQLDFP